MLDMIVKLYEYDTHIDSEKDNAISVTTLIGNMYRAQKYLDKTPQTHKMDFQFKRSSMIGTAIHDRAERVFKDDPDHIVEQFVEREIEVDGVVYTIAGSFDGIRKLNETEWEIYDYKSQYGKDRKEEMLSKDAKQMSIYRWLLEGQYNVTDRGWTLAISQSNNWQDAIPVELMSLTDTKDYIEERLYAISNNEKVDCHNTKYNSCLYCSYSCEERK